MQAEFSLPTISQRLFLRARELEDNSSTVESLQIFANDIVDLREVEDVVDLTSDADAPVGTKTREGNGFSGTLLGSADVPWSSSPESEKECSRCTLSNPSEVSSCQACDATFV